MFGNGIIDTHSERKSILAMRTWLAWHVPLILAVYGPVHGLQRFDLVMGERIILLGLRVALLNMPSLSDDYHSCASLGHCAPS